MKTGRRRRCWRPSEVIAMAPKRRRKSGTKQTDDEKLDGALKDSFPASDPVSFLEPAPKEPNDTPLDKEREQSR